METEMAHPHVIMADFVNKYKQIKPYLEQGNLDSVRFLLGEIWAISVTADYDLLGSPLMKEGVYERYKMVAYYMGALFSEKNPDEDVVKDISLRTNRYIAELELILGEDSHYKSVRNETQ